jgi:hypothetical protein
MSSLATSSIVLLCLVGGALVGMLIRRILPERHLNAESKDVVKLGMGLIGTMSALVLGLLVASAKSAHDAQKANLVQMSVKIVILDRVLAHYGSQAQPARELLRKGVARILEQMWPEDGTRSAQLDPKAARAEVVYDKIQELSPQDDAQRSYKSQALNLAVDIGQLRWTMFQQTWSTISTPLLVVVVFWVSVIFGSFGVMAPVNPTTSSTLLLCALAVAGAIFVILELDRPFDGLIQIPSTPLRNAQADLGR